MPEITLRDKYGRTLATAKANTEINPIKLTILETANATVQGQAAKAVQLIKEGKTPALLIRHPKKTYTGYVLKSELDQMNVTTVQIPANFAGLEAVSVPTRLEEQMFEIYDVDEQDEYVEISARHIFYRNLKNYTLWKPTEETEYTAAAVMRNVMGNALIESDFDVATDCTDTKPGSEFDFERKNLVECFLDPENGICKKFGLSLIRDNSFFYCLKEVGYDRGYLVESGKNLIGVDRRENLEGVATYVAAYGKDAKGGIVWMDHDGDKYIKSQYADTYAGPMFELYETDLQIGKDGVTQQNIQAKLLEAAQKRFSEDEIDKPEVTMTINFISLGDTEEFAQYRGLDKVYLYDILTIRDAKRGYNYSAQVIGVEHDVLTGRLISVTIGSIKNADASRKIATWQVPEVDGRNIRLLSIQAGMFEPGAIGEDDLQDHIIKYAHFASATIDSLNADAIQAITAEIETIIAGHITAESIKATAIDAINATLGTATITNGLIDNADIGFAHIQAATAESLIARDAVTDRYYIDKLAVRSAQMVQATVGELIVKAADNKYYKINVNANGSISTTNVTSSLTTAEKTAGVTSDGHSAIIETDLTVADLSASNMKAINALIDKLTAARIDVDELFARQAFLGKLNTTDISSNTYLQIEVNKKNKTYRQWATPSDPHEGDTWYKQAPQPISEMENYTMSQLEQYPMWAFDGYELYRYESNAWRLIDDPAEIRDTIARILMENDRIDIMVAQLDTEMDNKYTVRSGIAIELAGIEISGSKYVRIKTGGKFTVDSGNFNIDEAGNVVMAGKITSVEGEIAGWSIGALTLTGNKTGIGKTTNDSDIAFWAGNAIAANGKYRVTQGGDVYLNSLMVWNPSTSQYEAVDFSRDFSDAVSYSSGSWSGDTFVATLAIFGRNMGKTVNISGTCTALYGYVDSVDQDGSNSRGEVQLRMTVGGSQKPTTTVQDVLIDASKAYKAGWNAALSACGIPNGGTVYTGSVREFYEGNLDVYFYAVNPYYAHSVSKK